MISIEESITKYSAPSTSIGIGMPKSFSTCFICAFSAGSFTPIGLPIVIVRLAAPLMPSGALPEADMPSRNLRTM